MGFGGGGVGGWAFACAALCVRGCVGFNNQMHELLALCTCVGRSAGEGVWAGLFACVSHLDHAGFCFATFLCGRLSGVDCCYACVSRV